MKQESKSISKTKRRKRNTAFFLCIILLMVTMVGNGPSMASDVDLSTSESSTTSPAIAGEESGTTTDANPTDEKLTEEKPKEEKSAEEKFTDEETMNENSEVDEQDNVKTLAKTDALKKDKVSVQNADPFLARFSYEKTTDGTGVKITAFNEVKFEGKTLEIPVTLEGLPVKEIGADSMQRLGYLDLDEVIIPEGVTEIGSYAFKGANVKIFKLPNSLEILGTGAFQESKITKIDMSNTQVTTIPSQGFYQTKSLANIVLPNGLKKIGNSAFYQCLDLTEIKFPNSLEDLDSSYIFSNVPITKLDLSNTKVTIIGNSSFRNTSLKQVILNEGLKEIKGEAFRDGLLYNNPKTIIIPSTVTTIASNAFTGAYNVTFDLSAFDPGQIKYSPWGAKGNCVVQWNSYDNNTCFWINKDGYVVGVKEEGHDDNCGNVNNHKTNSRTITLPTKYTDTEGKEVYVAGIGANAFQNDNKTAIVKFEAGSKYTEIQEEAFRGSSVYEIELPSTVTTIGKSAFEQASLNDGITIPDSVTSIGARAFYNSTLNKISLSKNITKIEDYTFFSCDYLTEVTIPAFVTEIGTQAFAMDQGDNKLKKITINGSGNLKIAGDAFKGTIFLTEIDMLDRERASVSELADEPWGANYATITYKNNNTVDPYVVYYTDVANGITWGINKGNEASQNIGKIVELKKADGGYFSKLKPYKADELVVPASFEIGGKTYKVNSLAPSVFNGKLEVGHLKISEGIAYVENAAAADCPKIGKVTFPKSMHVIATQAFFKSNIDKIEFSEGKSELTISLRSFSTNNLTSVQFPSNLHRIDSNAFEDNDIKGAIEFDQNVKVLDGTVFTSNAGITQISFNTLYSKASENIKGKGRYGAHNARILFLGSVPTVTTNAIEKNDRGRNITLEVGYSDPGMNVGSIVGVNPKINVTNKQLNYTKKSNDYFVYENGTYEFEITNAIGDTVTHQAIIDDIGKMTLTAGNATVNALGLSKITAAQIAKKSGAVATDIDSTNTQTGISYEMSDSDINKVKALANIGESVEVTLVAKYTAQYPDGALGVGNEDLTGKTYTNTISKKITVTLGEAIFDVSFDINGGTGDIPATQTVKYQVDKIKEPTETITYKGYIFDGWYKEKINAGEALDSSKKWNFATDDPESDMTLYAGWKSYSYTVTFDVNATNATAVEPMKVESPATTINSLPDQPKREGYTFEGWTMNQDGTGGKFNDKSEVTQNMTVYAQWAIGYYQMSFNLNGASGTAPATQSISFGSTATAVDSPAWDGYKFLGWNTKADGTGTTWNFAKSTMPASNVVLYAQWENDGTVAGEEGKNDDGTVAGEEAKGGNDSSEQSVLGEEAKTSDSMELGIMLIIMALVLAILIGVMIHRKKIQKQ